MGLIQDPEGILRRLGIFAGSLQRGYKVPLPLNEGIAFGHILIGLDEVIEQSGFFHAQALPGSHGGNFTQLRVCFHRQRGFPEDTKAPEYWSQGSHERRLTGGSLASASPIKARIRIRE